MVMTRIVTINYQLFSFLDINNLFLVILCVRSFSHEIFVIIAFYYVLPKQYFVCSLICLLIGNNIVVHQGTFSHLNHVNISTGFGDLRV